MTREQYKSLKLVDLKAIAAQRGMALPSRLRKGELIDLMIAQDEQDAAQAAKESTQESRESTGQAPAPAKEMAEGRRYKEEPVAEPAEEPLSGREPYEDSRTTYQESAQKDTAEREDRRRDYTDRDYRDDRRRDNRTDRRVQQTRTTYGRDTLRNGRNDRQDYSQDADSRYYPRQSEGQEDRYPRRSSVRPDQPLVHKNELNKELDSGEIAHGILEVMQDGFGFIRSANYMPGEDDVYVAPSQIRRFNLKTGDIIEGNIRIRTSGEKFSALLFVKSVNGLDPEIAKKRFNFENMTPIFPNEKIRLERPGAGIAMRVMDLMCPVGKGQRGMIVSPPKAGKTTLLKEVASSVKVNNPEIHLIILLIDERPEEVTDIKEAIEGPNVEVIYSTFDELPDHHRRVSEMVIERAKRLVEQKKDVMILIDSITRLTRAYNMTVESSGRTLTGGLDPAALHMPKRFFGAARNMREGGSLTILATALIDTGSKMDDVVYEEFKGTGNMEMILNRKLSERRIFPAVDLAKSGTRRDDLLLTPEEQEAVTIVRRMFIGQKAEEVTDTVLDMFARTRTNADFVNLVRRSGWGR